MKILQKFWDHYFNSIVILIKEEYGTPVVIETSKYEYIFVAPSLLTSFLRIKFMQ